MACYTFELMMYQVRGLSTLSGLNEAISHIQDIPSPSTQCEIKMTVTLLFGLKQIFFFGLQVIVEQTNKGRV